MHCTVCSVRPAGQLALRCEACSFPPPSGRFLLDAALSSPSRPASQPAHHQPLRNRHSSLFHSFIRCSSFEWSSRQSYLQNALSQRAGKDEKERTCWKNRKIICTKRLRWAKLSASHWAPSKSRLSFILLHINGQFKALISNQLLCSAARASKPGFNFPPQAAILATFCFLFRR